MPSCTVRALRPPVQLQATWVVGALALQARARMAAIAQQICTPAPPSRAPFCEARRTPICSWCKPACCPYLRRSGAAPPTQRPRRLPTRRATCTLRLFDPLSVARRRDTRVARAFVARSRAALCHPSRAGPRQSCAGPHAQLEARHTTRRDRPRVLACRPPPPPLLPSSIFHRRPPQEHAAHIMAEKGGGAHQ